MQGTKSKIWVNFRKTNKIHALYPCFTLFHIPSYRIFAGCILVLLSMLLIGCGAFSPPTDYYQKTLEMEENAKKTRQESSSDESKVATSTQGSVKVIRRPSDEPPIVEVVAKTPEENADDKKKTEKPGAQDYMQLPQITQEPEILPTFSANASSGTSNASKLLPEEPISVSPDIIKNALEIAEINVRSVELVNGRMEGNKNSVRVDFISESAKLVNERFFTICAVIYHLNKTSKTIDVVVGIAEDSQSNLLGVLQSNTEDITAWMNNKITRAEWFSRITRKML